MIVKELGADKERISLIPSTAEMYISFAKMVNGMQLRFLDSYRFMQYSLEKLVSYMEPTNFKRLSMNYMNEYHKNLLMGKGVFPYDYLSSWERLQETSLRTKNKFFSKLRNEGITDEDYNHAQIVWDTFDHQSLGDYLELYLKTDVLLLADIFENFRDVCIAAYGLDPAYYYTTPGLSWDAMLKMTGVELELLTEIDMLLFFERGIRGGISQCCNRYAKANNKYISSNKSKSPQTFLMYFDACNLYGWAMTQCLPHGGFEWVTDWTNMNIMTIPENGPVGYVFEVDLEYPQH